jgi:hypothetical protein
MIILNLSLKHIYGFEDFSIDFGYPKKIVNSLISDEHLSGRERFRYKKAVILMGANATGKTCLGRAIKRIFDYINDSNPAHLFEMVTGDQGAFTIDLVNGDYRLQRLSVEIDFSNKKVSIKYYFSNIDTMDSYEKCVEKLEEKEIDVACIQNTIGPFSARFAYPEIENSISFSDIDKNILLETLSAVIGTLDPTLCDISISKDLKDTFIIRRASKEIIIQEGKLLNSGLLSSGTAEGIDIAFFLASIIAKEGSFYYCDEHFSYIHSDIEKRIFSIMVCALGPNEQLIFTTHNTDMLDLNLPKHTYIFLRKYLEENKICTRAISASSILKRNTDSVRCAVENDVFQSLPQDSLLDKLEMRFLNGE